MANYGLQYHDESKKNQKKMKKNPKIAKDIYRDTKLKSYKRD